MGGPRGSSARGAKVVAVSDVHGGVHDPDGLDVADRCRTVLDAASLADPDGVELITNEELLGHRVRRAASPPRSGEVITEANADAVQARIVSRRPTTP